MRTSLTFIGLLLVFGLVACNKEDSGAKDHPAKIEAMPAAEIERAKKACDAYVERICSCAEANPDLASDCELAKASPGALQLNLDLLASEGLEVAEQKAVKVEARKIAAVCFQSESQLDPATCPRKTP